MTESKKQIVPGPRSSKQNRVRDLMLIINRHGANVIHPKTVAKANRFMASDEAENPDEVISELILIVTRLPLSRKEKEFVMKVAKDGLRKSGHVVSTVETRDMPAHVGELYGASGEVDEERPSEERPSEERPNATWTIAELRDYAEQHEIEIPPGTRIKADILSYVS